MEFCVFFFFWQPTRIQVMEFNELQLYINNPELSLKKKINSDFGVVRMDRVWIESSG